MAINVPSKVRGTADVPELDDKLAAKAAIADLTSGALVPTIATNATNATNDSDSNPINMTYAKLDGSNQPFFGPIQVAQINAAGDNSVAITLAGSGIVQFGSAGQSQFTADGTLELGSDLYLGGNNLREVSTITASDNNVAITLPGGNVAQFGSGANSQFNTNGSLSIGAAVDIGVSGSILDGVGNIAVSLDGSGNVYVGATSNILFNSVGNIVCVWAGDLVLTGGNLRQITAITGPDDSLVMQFPGGGVTDFGGGSLENCSINLEGNDLTINGPMYLGNFGNVNINGGDLTLNGNTFDVGGGGIVNVGTMTPAAPVSITGSYTANEVIAAIVALLVSQFGWTDDTTP